MDACTYESITGLKNYYGFKSLLKNGSITGRYACDDDTIVFNSVVSYNWPPGSGFILNSNQVGVILNLTCAYVLGLPGQYIQDVVETRDVDGSTVALDPQAAVNGFVCTEVLANYFSTGKKTIVIAIFDLY